MYTAVMPVKTKVSAMLRKGRIRCPVKVLWSPHMIAYKEQEVETWVEGIFNKITYGDPCTAKLRVRNYRQMRGAF